MQETSNPFQAITEVFYKPNQVFSTLSGKDNWSWIPFFVVCTFSILPLFLYYEMVDFEWFKNYLVSTTMADVSPAEQQNFKDSLHQSAMKWGASIGVFVVILLINALYATYFTLMSRHDEKCVQGFTDWYGFMWWVSLPSIIPSLISLLVLATADTAQIVPTNINIASLAYLLDVSATSNFFRIAESIRLDMIWMIYLTAVGVYQWTGFARKKAWIVSLAPFVVLYGLWFVIAML
ncbi:YIP1 family protein [Aestuariibacter sp. A3R04]|uniref:YIP1 family protein n=1 Tax=Aestuariibacter sp. A3R04 TaxID=2841571 RepID=UPI001C08A608|nr:YIP1 family protein [Aestuariibacter sp. A3R04]MBU3022383.1 YIP1 family protein [Aestuariibacter sp. A3R04]